MYNFGKHQTSIETITALFWLCFKMDAVNEAIESISIESIVKFRIYSMLNTK